MKDFSKILIFTENSSTLKETSYDNKNRKYMIDSSLEVIDFDKVKEKYSLEIGLKEIPKSCDALYTLDDTIFFIEFKNGKVEVFDIRKKIYDTILIFTDLVECGISETRKKVEYILVYDKEKNKTSKSYGDYKKNNIIESESYNLISMGISKLANQEIIKFKIGDFQNYLLKDVHTYTKEEFEKFLKK